ncbi:MAG: hypothetical protein U9R34_08360 [Nanoarchaeota archaeon]|nr:hypothetical protein [Nanoarchaeota archaeon]
MKIVYTAETIKDGNHPINSRVAKESLKAMIEEWMMPLGLVKSYTITKGRSLGYPFSYSNPLKLKPFFGEDCDLNLIGKELEQLYEQPRKELERADKEMESKLKNANEKQLTELYEMYHEYGPEFVDRYKLKYKRAIKRLKEELQPYAQIALDLESHEYNQTRNGILKNLKLIDDSNIRGIFTDQIRFSKLLEENQKDIAEMLIKDRYTGWKRKNIAPLCYKCNRALQYGEGYWMARLLCPKGKFGIKERHEHIEFESHSDMINQEIYYQIFDEKQPDTAEEALKRVGKAYQVILNYDLIDKINRQHERKERETELKGRLVKKRKKKEEEEKEKEEPAAEPTLIQNINYIRTPEALREIKGSYSLQKGVYVIDFEIIVQQDNCLILQPGVELYFTKDAGIICEGKFKAIGKNGLEVLLTAKCQKDGWKNLYLPGKAEAVLDYAKFSYGNGRKDEGGAISGGAILLELKEGLDPSVIIHNSCFENNSTRAYGGVITKFGGNVTIGDNNRFKNNHAIWGGMAFSGKGDFTIGENNIFEDNSAKWGGVIYHRSNVTIKNNNIFKNNSAKKFGGVVYNHTGILNIDESKNTFINNPPDNIHEKYDALHKYH